MGGFYNMLFGYNPGCILLAPMLTDQNPEEFPWLRSRIPCLWTNSYFVSTVGGAQIEAVKRYIEEQRLA